jgi:hypothetical protein
MKASCTTACATCSTCVNCSGCSGQNPRFWSQLLERATQWRQQPALFYAGRHVEGLLDDALPTPVKQALADSAPNWSVLKMLDFCYRRALQPQHPSCAPTGAAVALAGLYLRGHWLRMPPHLLLPHLLRKALRSED